MPSSGLVIIFSRWNPRSMVARAFSMASFETSCANTTYLYSCEIIFLLVNFSFFFKSHPDHVDVGIRYLESSSDLRYRQVRYNLCFKLTLLKV